MTNKLTELSLAQLKELLTKAERNLAWLENKDSQASKDDMNVVYLYRGLIVAVSINCDNLKREIAKREAVQS